MTRSKFIPVNTEGYEMTSPFALTHTPKPGLAALGFALMLLTTPSYGQALFAGPPHNVIYWDGNSSNLTQLVNSSYTDVIVSFVTPDQNCYVNPNLPPAGPQAGKLTDMQNSIQQLHSVGKTVLISFGGQSQIGGGSGIPSGYYQACTNNMQWLASQLAGIVSQYNFDGVDIDFEDTAAFGEAPYPQLYDGIWFLDSLTTYLYWDLTSPHNIITHAPQTPYWTNKYNQYGTYPYQYPPYAYVYWTVGNYIAWFDNQFYNGGCYNSDGTPNPNGTDCTAQQKINDYQKILSSVGGMPSIMLVMGLPVSWCSTANNNGCTGDGFLAAYDPTGANSNDVYTLISQLQQSYPNQFGGIMGWDFNQDLATQNWYYQGYTWSSQVEQYLYSTQPGWYAYDFQTGLCLDSNSTGNSPNPVNTDSCAGLNSQYWQFSANSIVNQQTGWCLDSNPQGSVYTDPCNGGNYQNWQFFGYTIRNRQTGLCLDSNGSAYTLPCNGGNYQNWMGGSE
jgi:chitinase